MGNFVENPNCNSCTSQNWNFDSLKIWDFEIIKQYKPLKSKWEAYYKASQI